MPYVDDLNTIGFQNAITLFITYYSVWSVVAVIIQFYDCYDYHAFVQNSEVYMILADSPLVAAEILL